MNEVTRILAAIEGGDRQSAEKLLPLVYNELRRLAAHKIAQERPGQTLQATALVHEAYVRLVNEPVSGTPAAKQGLHWDSRAHFFAAAAEAMRRILIENARRKRRLKHGGDQKRVELEEYDLAGPEPDDDLLAMDEALCELEREEPVKAELVKLRYFAGLTLEEAAAAMDISRATAARYWTYARAWLYDRMRRD
ncbi:MAG: ECF-type sigma factor [Pirellulales bacterium]